MIAFGLIGFANASQGDFEPTDEEIAATYRAMVDVCLECKDLCQSLDQQPADAPVGEMRLSAIFEGMTVPVVEQNLPDGTKLYTRPQSTGPQHSENNKQWAGLTQSDMINMPYTHHRLTSVTLRAAQKLEMLDAEARLREQNDELLVALRGALEHWPVPSSICKDRPAYEAARAAIAKATGGAA